MADPKTEGHRLLLELRDPPARICAAIGVAKALLSQWRSGTKRPAAQWRAELSRVYGIPVSSWDRAAGAPEPKAPPTPAIASLSAPAHLGALERVDTELARLDVELVAATVAVEKHRIRQSYYRLLDTKAKLEHQAELLEDRVVREHPAWKRTRSAMLEALRPHPDAMRAVIAALERVLP